MALRWECLSRSVLRRLSCHPLLSLLIVLFASLFTVLCFLRSLSFRAEFLSNWCEVGFQLPLLFSPFSLFCCSELDMRLTLILLMDLPKLTVFVLAQWLNSLIKPAIIAFYLMF